MPTGLATGDLLQDLARGGGLVARWPRGSVTNDPRASG